MEALSLLKYWKSGRLPIPSFTVSDDQDEGPFFDMDFALPQNDLIHKSDTENDDDDDDYDDDINVELNAIDDTSKSGQFPIPVSLLRSATKFRVFMLGLKRSKSQQNSNNDNRKVFKLTVKIATESSGEDPAVVSSDSGEEKRNNKKEVMQRYLKLVNPREMKGIIMSKKSLGKSKSAVVYATSVHHNVGSNRRDDSLIEQQDGIQGAILHCKRSFNSSLAEMEGREESVALSRSASDPTHEKKRATTVASELTREKRKTNDAVLESN